MCLSEKEAGCWNRMKSEAKSQNTEPFYLEENLFTHETHERNKLQLNFSVQKKNVFYIHTPFKPLKEIQNFFRQNKKNKHEQRATLGTLRFQRF